MALTKAEFERRVRMEMRLALASHPDDPARECSRRARGLRASYGRGATTDARACDAAASRFRCGLTADDCQLCRGTRLLPRTKRIQAELDARGLPGSPCPACAPVA